MRDDLVERVLAKLMAWGPAEIVERGAEYQAMASFKYDEYEGYRPGELFLESFTAWLWQMSNEDRECAARFVRDKLVFISRAELDHAIETVYPDIIRPMLVEKAGIQAGIPRWQVSRIVRSQEFNLLQRRTLVLGLSDGARIDRLRRSSELSHEQFYLAPELSGAPVERMQQKLQEAVGGEDLALFTQVVLIDDFAGSGYTSIRCEDGTWEGRLERTHEDLTRLTGTAVVEDPEVRVVLYVASSQAKEWIERHLSEHGLKWHLHVVQQLGPELVIYDNDILGICERYFDSANFAVLGEHVQKGGGDVRYGFGEGRLPVVLSHNTPNNSLSILWADTSGRPGSANQRALFPRRHRHNAERP